MNTHETKSRFVAWFYELVRDHVVPGTVEAVMRTTRTDTTYTLSNGYLGKYGEDIRQRLGIPDGRFNLRNEVMKQAAWVMNVPLEQVTLEILQSNDEGYVYRLFSSLNEHRNNIPSSSRHDTDEAAMLEALVLLTNYWARKGL